MSEKPEAQTDPQFSDPNRVVGTPEEADRAPEGEGNRAEFAQYGADKSQFSIFDGAGNESVVRHTRTEEGHVAQGAGASSEEAAKEAEELLKDSTVGLSDKFSPGKH